jgi:hypothetical protein
VRFAEESPAADEYLPYVLKPDASGNDGVKGKE